MANNTTKKTYLLRYAPAKHEGVSNWRGAEFTYYIETFANINGEFFYAADLDNNGSLKRWNTERINEIITITE